MKYARIEYDQVAELFETDGDITTMFPPWIVWVDITGLDPQPDQGWAYDGQSFTAPPPYVPDPRPILIAELEQIDKNSARPLRALVIADPNIGLGSQERAELEALEQRAAEIRLELENLGP